jgi:capsid protein
MIKALRRLLTTLTFLAVIAAGIKAAFEWVAQSGDDDHEVFADDDRETV